MINFLIGANDLNHFMVGGEIEYKRFELGAIISEADKTSDETHLAIYGGRKFYINGKTHTSLRAGISQWIRGEGDRSKFIQGAVGHDIVEFTITHEDNQNKIGLNIKLPIGR